MAYKCISVEEVRTVIEKAEKALDECFDMLMDFRYCRNNLENAIIKFQPSLAECLFDLMTFYQKLQQEKDTLISLKNSYSKVSFSEIMKTNAKYSNAVKTTIEIGKDMGDAFAWFFYRDNRKELEKHFEHESTGLYVGGIGGQGELEFVKHNNKINGFYVVYHSITTMLRIGDFSLYDFNHGIAGIGELKTKRVNDTLQVSATITSKANIQLPKLLQRPDISFEEKMKELRKDFPRIKKQLGTHEELLRVKEADKSSSLLSSYEYEMINSLTPESPLAVNSDYSLLIAALWSHYNSLYDILARDENCTEFSNEDIYNKAKSLIQPESPNNMFFIGVLNTRVSLLSIPILWWDIDEKVCRDIYFRKLRIMTIFNPAKLLQYFIDDGFTVKSANSLKKFQIHKDIDDYHISVGNFDSICYLITNSFMKTGDVYAFSKRVTTAIENGEFKPDSRVDMHIRLDNFGKPTADTQNTYDFGKEKTMDKLKMQTDYKADENYNKLEKLND